MIYTREPHANEGRFQNIDQPAEYCRRRTYAKKTREELAIDRQMILVDHMDGTVQKLYGGLPNMIYIIAPRGKVVYHDRWTDAEGKEVIEGGEEALPAPSGGSLRKGL